MALPVENIIDIQGRLAFPGLGVSNMGQALLVAPDTMLKVGALAWAVDTWKLFTTASESLDYFEDTDEAYLALQAYFSAMPKPLNIKVWLRDAANDTVVESLAKAKNETWFFPFDVTRDQLANAAAYVTVQAWGGAEQKYFATSSTDAGIVNNAVSDDVMSQMVGAGVRYSHIGYDPVDKYFGLRLASLLARVNYSADRSAISVYGKKLPGMSPLDLNATQYATLNAKGGPYYTIVESGESQDLGRVLNPFSCSTYGEKISDVFHTEAMLNAATVAAYNVIMNDCPQTPKGQARAIQAVEDSLEQFYRNGFLGPRQYEDWETGETKIAEHGYVVLTKPEDIYLLSDVDRAAGKLYPIRARAFRAGTALELSAIIDVA